MFYVLSMHGLSPAGVDGGLYIRILVFYLSISHPLVSIS